MRDRGKGMKGEWGDQYWKRLFGLVLLVQMGLLLAVFRAGTGSVSEDIYLICLELITFTILFDMMLIIMRAVQRKKTRLREQLLEQEFADRLEQKQRETQQALEKEARNLADSLRQELEEAENCQNATSDDIVWDQSFCRNAIVNAVLRDKAADCKRKGISLEHHLVLPQQIKVSEYHLCSIFANLLDNAIEACETLPAEQRHILVISDVRGAYLCIRVRNSSRPEHASRPKREGHGLGLEIVRSIAEEYGGELKTESVEDEYRADVVVIVE